jgi:hypothetical protein
MTKEHPILFSTPMVKALLEGRKTQTRRILTPDNSTVGEGRIDWNDLCWDGSEIYKDTCQHGHTETQNAPLPFADGKANKFYPYEHQYLHVPYKWAEQSTIYRIYPNWEVGDKLWVRETWSPWADKASQYYSGGKDEVCLYRADYLDSLKNPLEIGGDKHWHPSIFMPRKFSRITLEIIGIMVERVQEISEADAKAEGVFPYGGNYDIDGSEGNYKDGYQYLWDHLNSKRGYSWVSNPWVWVIEFKSVEGKG